jgi:hypothetical protein
MGERVHFLSTLYFTWHMHNRLIRLAAPSRPREAGVRGYSQCNGRSVCGGPISELARRDVDQHRVHGPFAEPALGNRF